MTPEEFEKLLDQKAAEIKKAIEEDIPRIVESVMLEYVDDNFRNQAFEGERWMDSSGTILVKTGHLRRGFESEASPEQVRISNDVPYARAHNEGFEGEVSVPEHYRTVYIKNGARKTKSGKVRVKAHKKKMKLPKRQFAPITGTDSPTLTKGITDAIRAKIDKILKPKL